MKTQPSKPMEFRSSDGFQILVGRNNRQNDLLTTRLAYKTDLWLHVQKAHGSHVIIACAGAPVPDQTVTEAAELAVWYSQARQGNNVPVDLCPVRQVKKPGSCKIDHIEYCDYTYHKRKEVCQGMLSLSPFVPVRRHDDDQCEDQIDRYMYSQIGQVVFHLSSPVNTHITQSTAWSWGSTGRAEYIWKS